MTRLSRRELAFSAIMLCAAAVVVVLTFPRERTEEKNANADQLVATVRHPELEIGHPIPAFSLSALDGTTVTTETIAKDNVSVVVFWRSDSPKSLEQLSALAKIASRLSSDFSIFLINHGEGKDKVQAAVDAAGVRGTVLLDDDERVAKQYNVVVDPTTYFVERGSISGIALGPLTTDQLNVKIASLSPLR